MFKSNHERRIRYSIRKFSVGVASVAVASLFLGSAVHATEANPSESGKTTTIAKKEDSSTPKTQNEAKTTQSSELKTEKTATSKEANVKQSVNSAEKKQTDAEKSQNLQADMKTAPEKQVAKEEKVVSSKPTASTEDRLAAYKAELKKEVEKTNLPKERKDAYKKQIEQENDFNKLGELGNKFNEENREMNDKFLDEIVQELKYQKSQIEKMASSNGITAEDKDAFLKKIDQIEKKAHNDIKVDGIKALEDVKKEVLAELGKLFQSYKAYIEKEIQNFVNQKVDEKIKEKGLSAKEAEDDADIKQLRELEKNALNELDRATKNEDALEAKNNLIAEIAKLKPSDNPSKETPKPRVRRNSPETKAKGRVQNYEEANIELSKYMDGLLSGVAEELKPEDKPKFNDLVEKALETVDKYRDELTSDITEDQLNQILEKAKGELKSTVENFKKGLTKPNEEEAKKLEALVKQASEELKKLDQALAEVNNYPELPENNSDYRVQKYIWDDSKEVAPAKMQAFKNLLEKGGYTEQALQTFLDDFIYYQIHAQIEKMTRQVAAYRAKYPNLTSLEKEFESDIKQTKNNYGTLEGKYLANYLKDEFLPSFNKIQQIVAIQEALNKLDDETKTVPDGAKLTGEAGKAYNETRTYAKEVVDESKKLLSQTAVTMDELAMQLTKLNDAMSKLKEAKAKLVPEVKPQPENPGHQKPSTPGLKDKVAEAQKKVEEAEKKAKIQEEKDHRNYPTNTRKTIELEIAEAQVEVAKAELELAEAESQTPQDTDTINAAKAKVEAAKNNVKKLEKIKSDSEKSQAGEQKPTTPAPDTKPNHQSQPEGKQPSTPKEPDNKKPSVPTPEKPIPQPEKPKPEVKPQPETPKTSKIFTASDGKTKVTVVFDKTVDADKVNIKEVTTKELADKIARKTGGGTVRVFDLSLSKGGKETHVNGERTVRLALGQTGSDVHVYHVKENGDLEHIPSKVENGQVVFKTSHFSLFAIKTLSKNQNVTTPKQTKPSIQDSQTQIGENQTGKFQNKEVNPKPLATGNKTMAKENPTSATEKKLPSTGAATNLVLEIIGLLGLAGTSLIAMKRRK